MRHYLVISATHKILIIYRASLSRALAPHERRLAGAACVDAAHAIVDELDRGGTEGGVSQSLWTIPYHGLAAGVVLGIDLIKLLAARQGGAANDKGERDREGDAAIEKRRAGVKLAQEGLERLSATSRIARRGLQVLHDLLAEADSTARREGGKGKSKGAQPQAQAQAAQRPAKKAARTLDWAGLVKRIPV
jgi:hypothetical protein